MTSSQLDIHIEKVGPVTIVMPVGPVDSESFNYFKQTLDPICKEQGAKVVIDGDKLNYINSQGIGLIASYHRTCLINNGAILLCSLNDKIINTMNLLGLGKRLKIFKTRQEACDSIQ